MGGFANHYMQTQWLELVLILYIYTLLYHVLRPSRWRALLASVPIILFYLVHDLFFLAYSKVFRWINVNELPLHEAYSQFIAEITARQPQN